MSDYRSDEYYSDDCTKCNKCDNSNKRCSKKVKRSNSRSRSRSRSCSPEKYSCYWDCDYRESKCCENYQKCKCIKTCDKNECRKSKCKCERKYSRHPNEICKKKDKYDECNKLKVFEDTLYNAKNEKIFFITIG